jgi:hypothetical protein
MLIRFFGKHKEHKENTAQSTQGNNIFLLWARYKNCNAAWLGNTKGTKKIQHKEHRERR